MKKRIFIPLCLLLVFAACRRRGENVTVREQASGVRIEAPAASASVTTFQKRLKSATAQKLDSLGFVDISDIDPSIKIHLVYSTSDNFLGRVLYDDLTEAYFHPDAARAVAEAQRVLKERNALLTLLIYDAARPMSVQQQMWDAVKGTSKKPYVSNPANGGGMHNYGLAADCTIAGEDGVPLPMGSDFDHLGPESHITDEAGLVMSGRMTEEERQNRLLLREVMTCAGFRALNSEWWHFNLVSREAAKARYQRLDF